MKTNKLLIMTEEQWQELYLQNRTRALRRLNITKYELTELVLLRNKQNLNVGLGEYEELHLSLCLVLIELDEVGR